MREPHTRHTEILSHEPLWADYPVCFVPGGGGICQPTNPCGSPDGIVTIIEENFEFSDGYDLVPPMVDCQFHIVPDIPTQVKHLSEVRVSIKSLDVGPTDGSDTFLYEGLTIFDGISTAFADIQQQWTDGVFTNVNEQVSIPGAPVGRRASPTTCQDVCSVARLARRVGKADACTAFCLRRWL